MFFCSGFLNSIEIVVPLPVSLLPPVHFSNEIDAISCGKVALRFCFVELMNEVYRVLKPGGIFLSHTPIFPFPASQQDPTHVNLITEDTFPKYFDDSSRFASMYGFTGSFKVEDQLLSPPYLISVLRKN